MGVEYGWGRRDQFGGRKRCALPRGHLHRVGDDPVEYSIRCPRCKRGIAYFLCSTGGWGLSWLVISGRKYYIVIYVGWNTDRCWSCDIEHRKIVIFNVMDALSAE